MREAASVFIDVVADVELCCLPGPRFSAFSPFSGPRFLLNFVRFSSKKKSKKTRKFPVILFFPGLYVVSAQMLEVSLFRSRSGAPSRKACVINGRMNDYGVQ